MPDNHSLAASGLPDPMAKWTPAPDWRHAVILREGWNARPVPGLGIRMIAGRIDLAVAELAPGAEEVGLWQMVDSNPHVIRIARDRALVINAGPVPTVSHWNENGWSLSPADGSYTVMEISGRDLRQIIAEATAADIERGSPSAAILFAGIPALLVRRSDTVARVFVETGHGTYLWRWLEKRR